jgi:hypothetical protein
MTESKKHSRRMQSHTGAVNSKVAQFLLRKKATQRKTKGNKVRVEEHQGLQDGEMQEGESGNRLRTLLQDVEANQVRCPPKQTAMKENRSLYIHSFTYFLSAVTISIAHSNLIACAFSRP